MVLGKNTAVVSAIFFAISIVVLSGCGSGPGSDGLKQKSSVSLDLNWPANYSFNPNTSQLSFTSPSSPKMMSAPDYVTSCQVTISGADMTPVTLDVPLSSGQVSGSVTPGERSFSVVVDTDFGISFTGSTTATLVPGYNGGISIDLSVNAPPTMNGISVSASSPKKRETVTLSASVTDPDTTDIQVFTWDGGGGQISGSGSSVSWSADLSGTYSVTVTADDGYGGVANGSVDINVTNTPPIINSVDVETAFLEIGDVINVSCSATDADLDRLSYSWSDGNGWSATGETAQYTAISTLASSLTCDVDDGDTGGRVSKSVGIEVNDVSATIPTGVRAVGGNAQVTISWNPSAGATSYNIYWSATSPVTYNSNVIAGVASPFVHGPLTSGTTYYYAITAEDSAGETALSAQVRATTL